MWEEPKEILLAREDAETVASYECCPYCGEKHAITWLDVVNQDYYCECGKVFMTAGPDYTDECEVCGGTYNRDYMQYDLAGRHVCDRCFIPDDDERWDDFED